MSNLHDIRLPEMKITSKGKEYHLTFDMNTFADLEEEYGSTQNFIEELKKISVKAFRKMFWFSLRDEYPDMTEREAGKLIGLDNASEIIESVTGILTAFGDALPEIAAEIKNLIPSQTPKSMKR